MRLVIDTNVLVSGLLSRTTPPSHLIDLWQDGEFVLCTSVEQIDELIGVTRYPKIRSTMKPALAGRLINEMRAISTTGPLVRQISRSPDPADNYLLAIASDGSADFLVSGGKRDLLVLGRHEGTKIVTIRVFLSGRS